jgi:cell division protein FtsX
LFVIFQQTFSGERFMATLTHSFYDFSRVHSGFHSPGNPVGTLFLIAVITASGLLCSLVMAGTLDVSSAISQVAEGLN